MFTFEAAHQLLGYDGACRHIHGHSYQLLVTLVGEPINNDESAKNGMVLDFGDLKKLVRTHIVDPLDHSLMLNKKAKSSVSISDPDAFGKIVWFDFQPTSENLLAYMASVLLPLMPEGVALHSLQLRETATAMAEWYASDNLS